MIAVMSENIKEHFKKHWGKYAVGALAAANVANAAYTHGETQKLAQADIDDQKVVYNTNRYVNKLSDEVDRNSFHRREEEREREQAREMKLRNNELSK